VPYRKVDVYIPEYYVQFFNKLEQLGNPIEIKLSRMVCRAVKDFVEDGNFDSISFKQYLLAHPEDKERIRTILNA